MKKPIKICKNPDCGDQIVNYISSKKAYCDDYCRNHHGYLRRLEFNLEFDAHKKGMAKNYKLLKKYVDVGINNEDLNKLLKFGFDPKYLPQKNIYKNRNPSIVYYIIKDIIFELDPQTNHVNIYPKKI